MAEAKEYELLFTDSETNKIKNFYVSQVDPADADERGHL